MACGSTSCGPSTRWPPPRWPERRPAPGLIHHPDRGAHHASGAYRAPLAAHGIVRSTRRRYACLSDAVAERFFATLEHDLLAGDDSASRGEARRASSEFLVVWYNGERWHSRLGYLSFVAYERRLARGARAV